MKRVLALLMIGLTLGAAAPAFADTPAVVPAPASPYILEYGSSDQTVGWVFLGLLLFFILTTQHSGTGPTCGKACP